MSAVYATANRVDALGFLVFFVFLDLQNWSTLGLCCLFSHHVFLFYKPIDTDTYRVVQRVQSIRTVVSVVFIVVSKTAVDKFGSVR